MSKVCERCGYEYQSNKNNHKCEGKIICEGCFRTMEDEEELFYLDDMKVCEECYNKKNG